MTISLHKDMFHNKVHNKVHNYNFSVVFALLPIICTKRFFATVYINFNDVYACYSITIYKNKLKFISNP